MARSLGVSPDQMTVTGDDAVEPAFLMRPPALGTRLGLNVRIARYASVDSADMDAIRQAVKRIIEAVDAEPQILPILMDEDRVSTLDIIPQGCVQHDCTVGGSRGCYPPGRSMAAW